MDSAWWADRYGGLFAGFGPITLRAHDPDLPVCNAEVPAWGARAVALAVGGIGLTAAAAEAACAGEAIERYMPYPLPRDRCVTACAAAWPLDEPCVEPGRWVLFHPDQYAQPGFPFRPFTREVECGWVCFRRWPGGEPVWVPEEFGYLFRPPGREHRIGPSISTGLSSGRGCDPLLLRGVQEVLERDAMTLGWWGVYPLEERPAEQVWRAIPEMAERVRRPNLRWGFFRVATPFSSHAVMVSLEGEDREGDCFSIGSACRETRAGAWSKAVIEAVHGRHFARHQKRLIEEGKAPPPRPPGDFGAHAVYYSVHPEELPATPIRRAPACERDGAEDAVEGLAELAERLGEDRPILWRLMTPPGIAQEAPEWRVVRVVAPGLQPLHGNSAFPHLGGRWRPRGLAEWRMLPPHPFP